MASTYKDLGLFNSGPHRFSQGALGLQTVPTFSIDHASAGTTALGPLELVVIVTGRLVADKDDDLWALRDEIAAQISFPAEPGTLVEHSGRAWEEMSFAAFTPADRTDRGRVVSLAYTAKFVRLLTV